MSYTSVITVINTILASATNVGTKIYNYDRLETDEANFKAAFKDTTSGYIRAWAITRVRIVREEEANYKIKRYTNWLIRGYHSFKKGAASVESDMQILIDNILAKFDENSRLDNEILTSDPMNVPIIEPRIYSGVLVHYTEFVLLTAEQETRGG